MGRSGIRRRIKKGPVVGARSKAVPREPDVIADLQDQAQWSSYTQDVPRLENEYRERLRLRRIHRSAGRAVRPRNKLGENSPIAIGTAALMAMGLAIALFVIFQALRLFF